MKFSLKALQSFNSRKLPTDYILESKDYLNAPLINWYERNWELIERLVRSIKPVDENDNILEKFDKSRKFLWKFEDEIIYFSPLHLSFDNPTLDNNDFFNDLDCYEDNLFPFEH